MVICRYFRINTDSSLSRPTTHSEILECLSWQSITYTRVQALNVFLHQIPWAKVRQTPHSLFKPLFSGCVCKEATTVKDTMANHDPFMGLSKNSREKVYILHQNQEVEVYGPSSESSLNFKSLIMAQVSRTVIYGYFKFWQKNNTVSLAQIYQSYHISFFYQLSLLLMPICSLIYRWII